MPYWSEEFDRAVEGMRKLVEKKGGARASADNEPENKVDETQPPPCPFCHEEVTSVRYRSMEAYVVCCNCEARGPLVHFDNRLGIMSERDVSELALKAWNNRAKSSEEEPTHG